MQQINKIMAIPPNAHPNPTITISSVAFIGLFLLWLYPVNGLSEQRVSHAIFTASAIISSVIISTSLFIRRCHARTYIFKMYGAKWIIGISGILVFSQYVIMILFIVYLTGEYEFTLAVLIEFDPAFQVADFWYDMNCFHTLKRDYISDTTNPRLVMNHGPLSKGGYIIEYAEKNTRTTT